MNMLKKLFTIERGWVRFLVNAIISVAILVICIILRKSSVTPSVLELTLLLIGITAIIELFFYALHRDSVDSNGFVVFLMNIVCLALRVVGLFMRLGAVVEFCIYANDGTGIIAWSVLAAYAFSFIIGEFVHIKLPEECRGYEIPISYALSFVVGLIVSFLAPLLEGSLTIGAIAILFIVGVVLMIKNVGLFEYLFPVGKAGSYSSSYVPTDSSYSDSSSTNDVLESGSFTYEGVRVKYEVIHWSEYGSVYVSAVYSYADLEHGQALMYPYHLKDYLRSKLRGRYKIYDISVHDGTV